MSRKVVPQVSIATARNSLPALVKAAEKGQPVEITRRGKPVAILLSSREFDRMASGRGDLWRALEDFRKRHDLQELNLEDALTGLRDTSPGRGESESGL